jgi:predicted enzyme related to lactoylglutathione lyase
MPQQTPTPKPDLHGSINHVSLTVSDLPEAMKFFGPLLKFLGYARHEQVDQALELVRSLGAEIVDGPGEFPFGAGGYYALYFLGPDRMKFEIVHMPLAERNYRQMVQALDRGSR